MKKLLFTLILLIPSFVFGQANDGFYRADFTQNGEASRTEADFEIKGENVVGTLKIGNQILKIRGKIENNGLTAETEQESGISYTIFMDLSKPESKPQLWKKTVQYTEKAREASQTYTNGNLRKIDFPIGYQSKIPDIPKLTIEYPKQTFPKEFSGTANVIVRKEGESTIYEVKSSALYANWDKRVLHFIVKQSVETKQKVWLAAEIDKLDYSEKIAMTQVAFVTDKAFVIKDDSGTEIRILEETDNEVVFRLTNVMVKNSLNNEIAKINGTIRAAKLKTK